jgi:thiamine pyrophosphokinase
MLILATLRIGVDGGSNRWLKFCKDHKLDLLPDLITGDMDSAEKETLDFYQKAGVTLIPTPDQDETDFTKALREAAVWFDNNKIKVF